MTLQLIPPRVIHRRALLNLSAAAGLAVIVLASTPCGVQAQPVTAGASGSWFSDWDTPPARTGTAAAGAIATAGANNRALAGIPRVTDPQVANAYDKGGATRAFRRLSRPHSAASTLSYALPQKYNANNNTFDYVVSASAFVFIEPTWFTAAASDATANDPQLIASPGTFGQTLRLGAGAQLFSTPDGNGIASSSSSLHFEYDALNILSLPIASIDISSANGTSPLATVAFNSDPRLHFYVAGSSSMLITDDEVTSLLNAPSVVSQLMSVNGLLSDLPLFHFTMDLTNTMLSPGAGFGAVVIGQAEGAGVPEPPTIALFAFALVGLALTRRRKQ